MFENVLSQEATLRLAADMTRGELPPSVLLSGPLCSGKGTAALELARALSCEGKGAPWNCSCPSCERHRSLLHPDLLLFGPRDFGSEIAASAASFLRDPPSGARMLFIRSVRKLLARFTPTLWEGEEAKLGKSIPLIASLEELLEELAPHRSLPEPSVLEKTVASILSTSAKLESDGVADTTPIAQIRRASYWARLAPNGLKKTVIIENADRMHEGARNALLKILEEPPESSRFILTTSRRGSMMQTILSRVRTYAFVERPEEAQREVVRRVFRDVDAADPQSGPFRLYAYLEGFLPVSPVDLAAAASFFAASALSAGFSELPRPGAKGTDHAASSRQALGEAALEAASRRASSFPSPVRDGRSAASLVVERCGKFEPRSLFPRFLSSLLETFSPLLRADLDASAGPTALLLTQDWGAAAKEAAFSVGTYNQTPPLALERLFFELSASVVKRIG